MINQYHPTCKRESNTSANSALLLTLGSTNVIPHDHFLSLFLLFIDRFLYPLTYIDLSCPPASCLFHKRTQKLEKPCVCPPMFASPLRWFDFPCFLLRFSFNSDPTHITIEQQQQPHTTVPCSSSVSNHYITTPSQRSRRHHNNRPMVRRQPQAVSLALPRSPFAYACNPSTTLGAHI